MDEEIKKSLFDIKTSIESIYEYLGEKRDFERFKSKKIIKRAVEREFEIIGEALNRILKIDNTIAITSSRKIVDLRNYIIHAYDNVADEILWGIIINHLPKLEKEVKEFLKEKKKKVPESGQLSKNHDTSGTGGKNG